MRRMLLVKLPEPKRETQKACYMPPLGLWSIAHNFHKWAGTDVVVEDHHLSPTPITGKWDAIGLSVQFSMQHGEYLRYEKMARPHTPIILAGGFHSAAVDSPKGVTVIHGEGETGLLPMKYFSDIDYPEITEKMMAPYWEKGFPHDLQSKTNRWMSVEFSRGCFRNCGFCGVRNFWGRTRYYSSDKISRNLRSLFEIGVKELFLEDDNVATEPTMLRWIIGQMRRYEFAWSTPNGIQAKSVKDALPYLEDSGCWRVSLPFETGSPKTANLMHLGNKWMDFEEARGLVESLNGIGIKTCGFFIIGYPGESLEDMKLTLDYANSLPLDQRNIYIATPYPGTPLYDLCVAKGYLAVKPPALYESLLYTKGLIKTPEFIPDDVERLKSEDREKALKKIKKMFDEPVNV